MKKPITWIKPTECRKQSVRVRSKSFPDSLQPGSRRENPVCTDQTVDLSPKRGERNKIDHPDQTEKPTPRRVKCGATNGVLSPTPKQCRDSRSQFAMAGHALICNARQRSESGNELIAPERHSPGHARPVVPSTKYRLGTPIHFPVGSNQSNRRLKTFDRYVFVETVYLRLERSDIDFTVQPLLPPANPAQTKPAFAIV